MTLTFSSGMLSMRSLKSASHANRFIPLMRDVCGPGGMVDYIRQEDTYGHMRNPCHLGIYRMLNKEQEDSGIGGGWLRLLAHYVLSGWYAVFAVVEKTPENGVEERVIREKLRK